MFHSLKKAASGKTAIVIGGSAIINVSRIASTIVLTRLLTAGDFGVIGIIMAVAVILVMLTDVGFFQFVVGHAEGEEEAFLDEIWTLRVIRGTILTVFLAVFSGPIAAAFDKPELALPLAVSGLLILIESGSSMAFALAARKGQLFKLTMLDLVPHLFQVAAAILFCAIWPTFWSILAAMLASALLKLILSYSMFQGSRRVFRFSRSRFDEVVKFARHIIASSGIQAFIGQIDKVALARLWPINTFGLYTIATNLSAAPASLFSYYPSRVLFPAVSTQFRTAPEAVRSTYYSMTTRLRALYAFGSGGFAACAPLIVEILYDDRYRGAAIFLMILALGSAFRFSTMLVAELMIAVGQNNSFLTINLVRLLALTGLGALLYAIMGPIGIVLAVGLAEAVAQIYCWIAMHGAGLLKMRDELLLLIVLAAGFLLGWVVNYSLLAALAQYTTL